MWAISQLVSADRGPSISTPFSVKVEIWNWKKSRALNENTNPVIKEVLGLVKGHVEGFSEMWKIGDTETACPSKYRDSGIAQPAN